MKEKVQVNYDVVNMESAVELTGKNGDKIMVYRHIPYTEKEMLAFELAAGTFVCDDENKLSYTSYKRKLIEAYLIAKYYTNIDVEDAADEDDYIKVFDYLVHNELYEGIMNAIAYDYNIFSEAIMYDLLGATMQVFEKQNSFTAKLEKVFGFMFTGEDLTEQIAAAEDINGKLVDMFKAVQERDAKNALLKNGKAKVNSGGAVLNMAKK